MRNWKTWAVATAIATGVLAWGWSEALTLRSNRTVPCDEVWRTLKFGPPHAAQFTALTVQVVDSNGGTFEYTLGVSSDGVAPIDPFDPRVPTYQRLRQGSDTGGQPFTEVVAQSFAVPLNQWVVFHQRCSGGGDIRYNANLQ